ISTVGGWKLPARRSRGSPGSLSKMTTGTSRSARLSATVRPAGPAPTMMTGSRTATAPPALAINPRSFVRLLPLTRLSIQLLPSGRSLPHNTAHDKEPRSTLPDRIAGRHLPAARFHDPPRAPDRGGDLSRGGPRAPHNAHAIWRARDPRAEALDRSEH